MCRYDADLNSRSAAKTIIIAASFPPYSLASRIVECQTAPAFLKPTDLNCDSEVYVGIGFPLSLSLSLFLKLELWQPSMIELVNLTV